jgi:hypothetical protein
MISPSEREMNAQEAASTSKPWNYIFVQGQEEAILRRQHSNLNRNRQWRLQLTKT